jgi:hypothetical protein
LVFFLAAAFLALGLVAARIARGVRYFAMRC